jgi:hypothetical protein
MVLGISGSASVLSVTAAAQTVFNRKGPRRWSIWSTIELKRRLILHFVPPLHLDRPERPGPVEMRDSLPF